jgi:hypothetical protein
MLAERKKKLRPSRKVLEAVSEGLKEIEAYFELNGFSASEEESPVKELPQEGAGELEEGER